MSSLVARQAAEKSRKRTAAPKIPLVNDVALPPNLGDPVSKASKECASISRSIRPRRRQPRLVIELLRTASWSSRLPMPVRPADANGRIQQLGRLPIDQVPPGTYELRAIVRRRPTARCVRHCCVSPMKHSCPCRSVARRWLSRYLCNGDGNQTTLAITGKGRPVVHLGDDRHPRRRRRP